MEGQNRRVRKFIKCSTCKVFDSVLIDPSIPRLKCHNCKQLLKEISESEYKQLKQKAKEIKERRERERNNRQNDNHNRINAPLSNDDNNRDRGRGNSSLHYSRMNINNVEERNGNNVNRNQNNNNMNRNQNNNINRNQNNIHNHPRIRVININNNNNRHRGHNNQNNRRRDHSSERQNNNNFFEHIIGNILRPLSNMGNPMIINNSNRNPFRIVVQRQNVSHDIFDPFFSTFGSVFNGVFQDNFSSNFRSNYRGNFFNEILRILQQNQDESRRHAHPPASNENLNKLKKFDMNEKYCKKEKDGKVELPNCCICLDEIALGEKTVLLPCGHMFHSDCIITWLKKNNTCPMCRFEIK